MAMIDRIRSLFSTLDSSNAPEPGHDTGQKRLAAAVLMTEAALMDGNFGDEERTAIKSILARHFALREAETATLMDEAARTHDESSHLIRFTRVIKDAYPIEERAELIEMLWEVAYADGVLHDYEANLLRRVSGLLYVSDRDQGAARKRVLARLAKAASANDPVR